MTDFYFERYMDQAAKALEGPMEQVGAGTLIKGIEDIGGAERAAIAQAVPAEAALLARVMRESGVEGSIVVERSPLIPVSGGDKLGDDAPFERGWYLGKLVDGATYAAHDGTIRHEADANAFLGEGGTVYAYSRHMLGNPVASGIALNRYAPVCATSMNDRAMLFGMAVQAAAHDLEIPRTS